MKKRGSRGNRTRAGLKPAPTKAKTRGSKPLWSGRFKAGPAESLKAIGDSLHFDKRLAPFDIRASIAHARMLGKQRIIPKKDAESIVRELGRMKEQIEAGTLKVEGDDEDVHSWIERTLTERIGAAGK